MIRKLTYRKLRRILTYYPKTGKFIRNIDRGVAWKKGEVVGTKSTQYTRISIDGKIYQANRLAWFYMEGYWPEHDIDHKDRNPSNNKWENLRHITHQCNLKNSKIHKHNTSGVMGVYFDNFSNKWKSQIQVNSKVIHIGRFVSFRRAVVARYKAEKKYGWDSCNSATSAYLYLKEHRIN